MQINKSVQIKIRQKKMFQKMSQKKVKKKIKTEIELPKLVLSKNQ